jgi:hypothetical protein
MNFTKLLNHSFIFLSSLCCPVFSRLSAYIFKMYLNVKNDFERFADHLFLKVFIHYTMGFRTRIIVLIFPRTKSFRINKNNFII